MRVLVVGANGQIGKQIIELLNDSEHTPLAMVRKEEQANAFQKKRSRSGSSRFRR